MKGIVFFDCDGVLTEDHSSWLTLHEYFGSVDNSYFADLYRKNIISYLDWMKIDIAIMINSWKKPIRKKDVENALSKIRIRSESLIVTKMLKQMGYLVGIISSGIDLLVKRVCSFVNSDICLYNELIFINNELIPGGRDWIPLHEKVFIIESLAKGLGIDLDHVVYVGDSIWDIPIFHRVGLSIAIEPCGEACNEADYIVKSLLDIPYIVEKHYRY